MDIFAFEDAANHSGLALSNHHPATHVTEVDLACAEGYTAAISDDHEPEVLEQMPPDGM